MVPADSDRIPRVPPYSGGSLVSNPCLYGGVTLCAGPFRTLPVHLGSVPFDRHYSGHRLFFLFLRVLRCFSSPGSPQITLVHGLQPCGLPHSEMRGSSPVCRSPRLIAAYHVLRRLRKPRHPPFALLFFLFVNQLRLFGPSPDEPRLIVSYSFAYEIAVPLSQLDKKTRIYSKIFC